MTGVENLIFALIVSLFIATVIFLVLIIISKEEYDRVTAPPRQRRVRRNPRVPPFFPRRQAIAAVRTSSDLRAWQTTIRKRLVQHFAGIVKGRNLQMPQTNYNVSERSRVIGGASPAPTHAKLPRTQHAH